MEVWILQVQIRCLTDSFSISCSLCACKWSTTLVRSYPPSELVLFWMFSPLMRRTVITVMRRTSATCRTKTAMSRAEPPVGAEKHSCWTRKLVHLLQLELLVPPVNNELKHLKHRSVGKMCQTQIKSLELNLQLQQWQNMTLNSCVCASRGPKLHRTF